MIVGFFFYSPWNKEKQRFAELFPADLADFRRNINVICVYLRNLREITMSFSP